MNSRSSKTETAAPPERIDVGRVLRAHGVRGAVLVASDSDVPGRFRPGATLWIESARGSRSLRILRGSRHPHGLLLVFEGVSDRDAAAALAGGRLTVDRSQVPPAPDGSWYYFQLIGCRCVDRREGPLGEVTDVIEDGGGILLIVEERGRRIPVPFVHALVPVVDPDGRRLELDLPEGFLAACASPS